MKNFPCIAAVQFKALGTDIEIQLVCKDKEWFEKSESVLGEVKKIYADCEKTFSRFDSESELSKLNKNLQVFQEISSDMREVVESSLEFHEKTNGFFDPRIIGILEKNGYKEDFKKNNFKKEADLEECDFKRDLNEDLKLQKNKVFFGVRMDFSGIVKGFITDKIAEFLGANGWKNFLVDSGGDMYFGGKQIDLKKGWAIEIEGVPEGKQIFIFSEMGIATSGISRRKWEIDGERFHHLINPKKQKSFDFKLKSVTVVAQNTETADVMAKTLCLMGKEEGIAWAREKEIAAVFLDSRANAMFTPKAKEFLNG